MVAERSPESAVTLMALPGAPAGITEFDDAASPVPTALTAATVNEYRSPLTRPLMALPSERPLLTENVWSVVSSRTVTS